MKKVYLVAALAVIISGCSYINVECADKAEVSSTIGVDRELDIGADGNTVEASLVP